MSTPMPQERALVIARNLPPLRGGIERLMERTLVELSSGWRCDVLGPTGSRRHLPSGASAVELPASYAGFLPGAFLRVLAGERIRYGFCLASSGVMAPLARLASYKHGCPYVVWVHGLDLVHRGPGYAAAFLPAIRAAHRVVANSSHTAALARGAGIEPQRITIIRPGVAIAAPAALEARRALRERFGLGGRPLLLSAGRLVPRKGVVEFVEHGLPRVREAFPAVQLLVVGAEPGRSGPGSGPYGDQIRAAARRAGLESAVVLAGELDDADLAAAYGAADVLVFPALALPGDVEGFGMVIIEAAAQGTPTAAFALGGIPDAMSRRNGALVEPGNYGALAQAIGALLRGEAGGCSADSCLGHARDFSWSNYGAQVRRLCRALAEGQP